MNGLEKITQRIEQDAQAEAGQVLADARARADDIAAQWAEKARKEREDILERGRKNSEERAERLASVAQLEGRKQILAAKQEMIGQAFDRALEELLALPEELTGSAAGAFLDKVVTAGSALLAGTGMLTLAEETRPIQGGFILAADGVEVNCAFETLVRLSRPELERQVAQILFGE